MPTSQTARGRTVCPKNPSHGPLTKLRGNHHQTFKDTDVEVELLDFPAWVCEACARSGEQTVVIDEDSLRIVGRDYLSHIGRALRSGGDMLPKKVTFSYVAPSPSPSAPEESGLFYVTEPWRTFDMAVFPADTARQLDMVRSRIRNDRLLLDEWGLRRLVGPARNVAVLFHGPSGTGKSMAVEALALSLGRRLLVVNYAHLESKYVGETPKNLRRAFVRAQEEDCVLLMDEADSFLSKRVSRLEQSADYAVNVSRSQLLLELDSFTGIVVFATNLPTNIDPAFARRISLSVAFQLPGQEERQAILGGMIPDELPKEDGFEVVRVASESDGLAGGDLKNVVLTAATAAADRDGQSQHLKVSDLLDAVRSVREGRDAIVSPRTSAPVTLHLRPEAKECLLAQKSASEEAQKPGNPQDE